MATDYYIELLNKLKTIKTGFSDSECRRNYSSACKLICESNIGEFDIEELLTILKDNCDSNNGYHYNSDGVCTVVERMKWVLDVESSVSSSKNNNAQNSELQKRGMAFR